MFEQNVGGLDRVARLVVGVIMLYVGVILLDGLAGRVEGIVPAVLGLMGLATGATGFCPLYVPLGLSTAKRRQGTVHPTRSVTPI